MRCVARYFFKHIYIAKLTEEPLSIELIKQNIQVETFLKDGLNHGSILRNEWRNIMHTLKAQVEIHSSYAQPYC
eukprot:SAG31_NODE_2056_length_6546_cov_1.979060_6_plen_74_part_00